MKNLKKFLLERLIEKGKLKDALIKFNKDAKLDATGYYLKAGAPVLALAILTLMEGSGKLFILNDTENEMLHVVVEYGGLYWDINGGSDLKRKEEFVSTVGKPNWVEISKEDLIKNMNNTNEVYKVYKKLKDFYMED